MTKKVLMKLLDHYWREQGVGKIRVYGTQVSLNALLDEFFIDGGDLQFTLGKPTSFSFETDFGRIFLIPTPDMAPGEIAVSYTPKEHRLP